MPYQTCPSFPTCACNECPLDPASALRGGWRVAVEGEEPCRATRATRERIAVQNRIDPALVLLPRERRQDLARRRWEELPAEVRAVVLNAGSETRFKGPEGSETPVSSIEPRSGGVWWRSRAVSGRERACGDPYPCELPHDWYNNTLPRLSPRWDSWMVTCEPVAGQRAEARLAWSGGHMAGRREAAAGWQTTARAPSRQITSSGRGSPSRLPERRTRSS